MIGDLVSGVFVFAMGLTSRAFANPKIVGDDFIVGKGKIASVTFSYSDDGLRFLNRMKPAFFICSLIFRGTGALMIFNSAYKLYHKMSDTEKPSEKPANLPPPFPGE